MGANNSVSSTPNTPAIAVEGLTKRFGELTAVDDVSFAVDPGEVFGFLGPNGAGKTTTARMLTGVLRPDEGSAHLGGYDIRTEVQAAKREIGIVPEQFNAYPDLAAWQNLMLAGELYGVPSETRAARGEDLLRSFGLFDRRQSPTKEYSKGMKQRLMLAMALIHDPDVLFLDEPITGLDVQSQRLIRDRIADLNREGRTVFLTTHDIEEADRLCGRVAIINDGEVAAIDTPESLKETIERTQSVEVSFDMDIDSSELTDIDAVEQVDRHGNTYDLSTADPDAVIRHLVNLARSRGMRIRALRTHGPSLEDAFVELTEDIA